MALSWGKMLNLDHSYVKTAFIRDLQLHGLSLRKIKTALPSMIWRTKWNIHLNLENELNQTPERNFMNGLDGTGWIGECVAQSTPASVPGHSGFKAPVGTSWKDAGKIPRVTIGKLIGPCLPNLWQRLSHWHSSFFEAVFHNFGLHEVCSGYLMHCRSYNSNIWFCV